MQSDGVQLGVDSACQDVRADAGYHVTEAGVDFREEDGFVERCRVLERIKLHQLVVLRADYLARDEPADGADTLADVFTQSACPDRLCAAYLLVIERQRMPAHEGSPKSPARA